MDNLGLKQKDQEPKKCVTISVSISNKIANCHHLSFSNLFSPFPFLFHAAYGYGFLMVAFISLGSLCGVIIVPLVSRDSKLARIVYEYAYAFMIAVGASALLSDAILHLIPHVSLISVLIVRKFKNFE